MIATRLIAMYDQMAAESTQKVPSPCVSVCRMDADTGLCAGCLRTLNEIAAWSTMPESDKRRVWQQIVTQRMGPNAP